EVDTGVTPQDFRIDNVWERFEKLGDLFEGVRTSPQELGDALEAVGLPSHRAIEVGGSSRRRTSEEVIADSKDPDLGEYLRKRTFGTEGTTEPPPGGAAGEGNSFVIHKHPGPRLPYDVRLERDGALPSWAVPRGLPTQPGDRRLAVRTEDHPLEYGSFSGPIPEGHYGGGEGRIFEHGWEGPGGGDVPRARVPRRQAADRLAPLPRVPAGGAADPVAARVPADARRGRVEGVRRPEMVVRAEVRRDPLGDEDGDRRHALGDAQRAGRHRQIPGAADDPRARRPGERGARRRDRGVRRGREELLRGAAAADEPVERARDQADLEQDPGRAGRVRPALAGRQRPHGAGARGAARAPRDDRRAGPSAPRGHSRRGRREGVRRGGPRARPRGRRCQADGLAVPAGPALARLA